MVISQPLEMQALTLQKTFRGRNQRFPWHNNSSHCSLPQSLTLTARVRLYTATNIAAPRSWLAIAEGSARNALVSVFTNA